MTVCVGSLWSAGCGEPPEPGGTRCASCARWVVRQLAEEVRDREERAAAADAEWVATVTARHAGQGWRCTPQCRLCAEGSTDLAEERTIDGRLFAHATRPVSAPALPPVGQVIT